MFCVRDLLVVMNVIVQTIPHLMGLYGVGKYYECIVSIYLSFEDHITRK